MAEHYIPSNPFYSATVLHSATEQYRPGSRNADVASCCLDNDSGYDNIDNSRTCKLYYREHVSKSKYESYGEIQMNICTMNCRNRMIRKGITVKSSGHWKKLRALLDFNGNANSQNWVLF